MSNAIHLTVAGDTLETIAETYYHLRTPKNQVLRKPLKSVTQAIRSATPTDLSGFADDADLGADKVLFIPTMRNLNRALLVDDADVLTKFKSLGLNHARRLLKLSPQEILAITDPASDPTITAPEVARAYVITQFFNLDGMDAFTAEYLYDTASITSLSALAAQTVTTLNGILTTLTSGGRPAALATQGHARRWRLEARLYTRPRTSEQMLTTRTRFLPVPLPPRHHRDAAEHYRAVECQPDQRPERRKLARALTVVHRFTAGFLAGNRSLHTGRWPEAVEGYNGALRVFNRWIEASGVVASVDDAVGVSLENAIEAARLLLSDLADDPEPPLGGPRAQWDGRDADTSAYGARGFRYSELTSAQQVQLREAIQGKRVYQLPRQYREVIRRILMSMEVGALTAVSANLTSGLDTGPSNARVQDLHDTDKARLFRNLGSMTIAALYSTGLDVFDHPDAASRLYLWSIKDLAGALWGSNDASDVLTTSAQSTYRSSMLSMSPFIRFVEMPALVDATTSQFVVLRDTKADFLDEYEQQLLIPRLSSTKAGDIFFPRRVWETPTALALLLPWLYGQHVRRGLRHAHNRQGLLHSAVSYNVEIVNNYDSSGVLEGQDIHHVDASDPSTRTDLPTDESDASTPANWSDIEMQVEDAIAEADALYRRGYLDEARVEYEQARDVIVTHQASVYAGDLESEAQAAMDGVTVHVSDGGGQNGETPSLFDVEIVGGERFLEDQVMSGRDSAVPSDITDTAESAGLLPEWIGSADISMGTTPTVDPHLGSASYLSYGNRFIATDPTAYAICWLAGKLIFVNAMIERIDMGINWLGYRADYVPPWSFEHLYGAARDLAARAEGAEQRVLNMLQLLESAQSEELLATQAVESAAKQVDLAMARQKEQEAAAYLALQQAELSTEQAALAEEQNASSGIVGLLAAGGSGLSAGPFGLIGVVGAVPSLVQSQSMKDQYESITKQSEIVYDAQKAVNDASAAVAIAELDAAALQAAQALDYARWLVEDRVLTSENYAYLYARAQEIADYTLEHATRVSWLAQRAIVHQARKGFDFIRTSYAESDEVADMTRAQNLAADLEALRAAYMAGETDRRQELKWTITLGQHDPGALEQLRATGQCVIRVSQRVIDRYFPGMYLHSLQDLQLTFLGTLPADGVRGVLTTSGYSRVRVPNHADFMDGSRTNPDWLDGLVAEGADLYIRKELLCQGASLALSQFDVRSDRAVLQRPQGMLGAIQHLGLDTAWTLRLPRTANAFSFGDIKDVELTFWFLAAYDQALATRMEEAWSSEAASGAIEGVLGGSFAAGGDDQWQAFVRDASAEDAADVRYLVFEAGSYPPWETSASQRLTNLLLAVAPNKDIRLRVLTTADPVGTLVTTAGGAAFTDTSGQWDGSLSHQPSTPLGTWLQSTFFDAGSPSLPPDGTWVLKVLPAKANTGSEEWRVLDEDGDVVTSSGPLTSGEGGVALWNAEPTLTHVRVRMKVMKSGLAVRFLLRRADANNYYSVVLANLEARITKVVAGSATTLADTTTGSYPSGLDYPDDELLLMQADIYGDATSTTIKLAIDGIEILTHTDSSSPHTSGQFGFDVQSTGGTAQFDDLEIIQLSKTGVVQETLLIEPFTGSLPSDWTFTDGSGAAWAIASTGHPYFDPKDISDVVLRLDYQFAMGSP